MRVAIATSSTLPEISAPENAALVAAFDELGVAAQPVCWDETQVAWADYDAVLVRSTWDYTTRLAAFLQWLEHVAKLVRVMNPPDILRWNIRKTYLASLKLRGVRVVPTIYSEVGEGARLEELVSGLGWQDFVLKPVVSAGARETRRFDRSQLSQAQVHWDRCVANEAMMIQPFLASVAEYGEVSLIYVEGELVHAVCKRPAAGDFRTQDAYGAEVSALRPTPPMLALGKLTLAALNLAQPLSYARVDLAYYNHELHLMELELIEPWLYIDHAPHTVGQLASAVSKRLV